jgi:hypothetical protein
MLQQAEAKFGRLARAMTKALSSEMDSANALSRDVDLASHEKLEGASSRCIQTCIPITPTRMSSRLSFPPPRL